MKRPVILVDLDNVVYNWVEAMAQWLHRNEALPKVYYTEPLYDYNGNVVGEGQATSGNRVADALRGYSQWAVWDDWNIPKGEFIRWWRLGVEAGEIYRKGPEIEGARTALWKLSDAEWHIHIATSRLTKFGLHDMIAEHTAYWLREHNIPYRDLSLVTDKTRIMADAIVDDKAANMSYPTHMQCFEFGAPHNDSDITWDDVIGELRDPGYNDAKVFV